MATWMKVETRVRTHPKIAKTVKETGHADAAWLWHAGNLYCKDALTDGFIADEMLAGLVTNLPPRVLKDLPAVLVRHGLWHREEGGWRIHDWLKYNHSKAVVEERKAADRERKKEGFQTESERTTRAGAPASSPSVSASGSSEGVSGEPATTAETTPPTGSAPRGYGYGDPQGFRRDPSAAAYAIVSELQQIAIPGTWWERARKDRGLAFDEVDVFAKWLAEEVRRGLTVGANKLSWLDAELARWLTTRRASSASDAEARRTDAFLAEQAAHRATRATPDEIREGLRAGRTLR